MNFLIFTYVYDFFQEVTKISSSILIFFRFNFSFEFNFSKKETMGKK